jgi:hypothetical protein
VEIWVVVVFSGVVDVFLLFGLDKRIDGKDSSVDNFFSKLNKDNPHILQQRVCYLSYGSGNFFVASSSVSLADKMRQLKVFPIP